MIRRHGTRLVDIGHVDRILGTIVYSNVLYYGSFGNAHMVFDESPSRNDSRDWAKSKSNTEDLNLFLKRRPLGETINRSILLCVLKSCGCLADRIVGCQLHCLCVKYGYEAGIGVSTSLVDMYMKCQSVKDGRRVFDFMPEKNVVTWTALLNGYAQNGQQDAVLGLFFRMQLEGITPNPFTFACFLASAAGQAALDQGKLAHSQMIKFGHQDTVYVCNSLINMYSKCGAIREAGVVFDRMTNKNAVSWNTMIAGLLVNCYEFDALRTFNLMRVRVKPTQLTFASVIKLCASLELLQLSRQLHCSVVKEGFDFDDHIITALMVVYCKCGKMDDAIELFSLLGSRNVVSWTAMINGCIQNKDFGQATALFNEMRKNAIEPNNFTYSSLLAASPQISPLQIHTQIIKTNYQHVTSVGTALLNAYSKLGNTKEAFSIFTQMDDKDIVAWSAMLACYAQSGDSEGATKLFREMARKGVNPNEFTLSSTIDACASPTASADQGKQFHAIAIKLRHQNAIYVSSALVTMYSKRGSIDSAQGVFKRQPVRDLVSWNSMLSGYAQHGYSLKALEIFQEMEARGIEVDKITFVGVITACTHRGLVEEGRKYFDLMVNGHHITPTMEHYSCMVDLYSRAGKLEEALTLIKGMPLPATPTIWRTLLGACRVHRNIEIGELAAQTLISLEPMDSAAYVLLSNIYAAAGKWEERRKIRNQMDEKNIKKEAGCSWIQIKNKVHSFLAGDRTHPMRQKINEKLEQMTFRLKEKGYQPDTNYVLYDMEEEHKEEILAQHSERLALAFGLISTPNEFLLQIVKNLRVCGDCHTVFKLMSEIEKRELIVRDSSRFHHFNSGSCSCGDYW